MKLNITETCHSESGEIQGFSKEVIKDEESLAFAITSP